ncbi:MAG: hypothetical protein IT179_08550 [Acidobacteria bacterium]|nr:hypothetical protein [Acidobacteriota bacterium]
MNRRTPAFGTLALGLLLTAGPAAAQTAGAHPMPDLHVSGDHSSCFFDLHPELTPSEFDVFAREIGSILRVRHLGELDTLGRGRLDLSLQFTSSPIDDAKGAWNNTMSHPAADHDLGDAIVMPRIVGRVGVSDRVDLGISGALNPHANYAVAGVDTRIVLMRQGPSRPVTIAIRPSVSSLFGPAEVWAANASLDIAVGRRVGAFTPYVGVATSMSLAVERSDDVALDPAAVSGSAALAGVTVRWRRLAVSAEVERSAVTTYGVRVGTRF